jgi:hypothetical protein
LASAETVTTVVKAGNARRLEMDEPQKPEQQPQPQQPGTAQQPAAAGDGAASSQRRGRMVAAAVAIGAVLLEPELLPGIAIGVLAAMAPKLFPRATERLRPLGQSMRRTAEDALARGRALGHKAKERLAHVSERIGANGKTKQPA